jgi:signal transduction histidine kinase
LRSSLRFRLVLVCATVAAAAAAVVGIVVFFGSRSRLHEAHSSLGVRMAADLARYAGEPLAAGDEAALYRLLAGLESSPQVCYATIFDRDGERRATFAARDSQLPATALERGALDGGEQFVAPAGVTVGEFDAPILRSAAGSRAPRAATELLGTLRLGLSRQGIDEQLRSIGLHVGLLVLIAALLAAVGSIAWIRICLEPLGRLVAATRRIGGGDFEALKGGLERHGELGALTHALEQMAADLEAKDSLLRAANLELEVKVAARTKALVRALEEAQAAERVRDQVLSCVSHELRTPLASIRAFAEILVHHLDEPREIREEFSAIILQESDRLGALVSNMLDYVKFLSGEVYWVLDDVDLAELANESAINLRPLLESRGLSVAIQRHGERRMLRADRDKLQRVLANLLSNAIKFSPVGGRIDVEVRSFDRSEELLVRDQGSGIPDGQHDAIFERFHQGGGDPLTSKPSGAGLGLPLCREIVERHGGRIFVANESGGGAAFHVVLPLEGPIEARGVERRASARPHAS